MKKLGSITGSSQYLAMEAVRSLHTVNDLCSMDIELDGLSLILIEGNPSWASLLRQF
jgi:hypothetical protein